MDFGANSSDCLFFFDGTFEELTATAATLAKEIAVELSASEAFSTVSAV